MGMMFPLFSTFFFFVLENVVECTWRCLSRFTLNDRSYVRKLAHMSFNY